MSGEFQPVARWTKRSSPLEAAPSVPLSRDGVRDAIYGSERLEKMDPAADAGPLEAALAAIPAKVGVGGSSVSGEPHSHLRGLTPPPKTEAA